MMRRLISVLILAALTLALAAPVVADTVLRLRPELDCKGRVVTLGELLAEGSAGGMADRRVTDSPSPGHSSRISRNRVARLLHDWGWRGKVLGPESVELKTRGVRLAVKPLREAILGEMDRQLAARGLKRAGSPKAWPEEVTLSGKQIRWQVNMPRQINGREASVQLSFSDRAGFEVRKQMRVSLSRPTRVAVLDRPLAAGEIVAAWHMEERDANDIDGAPLGPDQLEGAVSRRALKVGTPLTDRVLKADVLVRSGLEVTIEVSRGAVTVRIPGIAQADGAMGEIITVRRLDNRRLERFRVIGRGTVSLPHLANQGDKA